MKSIAVFILRIIIGLIILAVVWFVLDRIRDRNTEIIVSTIGLMYAYIFQVSGRLQYFGLAIFSFFGRTTAYVRKIPYDELLRKEVGLEPTHQHLYLNVIFAALVELLCLFRLFSSLLGQGWEYLSDPIHLASHMVRM
jgi:hypothetical protein